MSNKAEKWEKTFDEVISFFYFVLGGTLVINEFVSWSSGKYFIYEYTNGVAASAAFGITLVTTVLSALCCIIHVIGYVRRRRSTKGE